MDWSWGNLNVDSRICMTMLEMKESDDILLCSVSTDEKKVIVILVTISRNLELCHDFPFPSEMSDSCYT